MKSTLAQLAARFDQALVAAFGADLAGTDPMLVPTSNPKFGDYQANLAMSLAKPLQQKPRDIAAQNRRASGCQRSLRTACDRWPWLHQSAL
jgi:arginyl-tRNA synthetase